MTAARLNSHRRVAPRGSVSAALKSGDTVRTPYFRMAYRLGEGPPGTAFLAGRRVGGAVRRNRAKRVLREAYRTSGVEVPHVETLVFVSTENTAGARFEDVRDAMIVSLKRVSDRVRSRENGKAASAA